MFEKSKQKTRMMFLENISTPLVQDHQLSHQRGRKHTSSTDRSIKYQHRVSSRRPASPSRGRRSRARARARATGSRRPSRRASSARRARRSRLSNINAHARRDRRLGGFGTEKLLGSDTLVAEQDGRRLGQYSAGEGRREGRDGRVQAAQERGR